MGTLKVEKYKDSLTLTNKLRRLFWNISCLILFRPFGLPIFKKWRILVLRLFGAKIGNGCVVHSSVKIWAPWNLIIGDYTAVGPNAELYNPAKIELGSKVTISQYAYLCTASHDFTMNLHPLITEPIIVNDFAWVAAKSFISMGVTIGEGAVVGATASVYKDVEPWTVVGGNPAKFIKKREIKD